jgi:hypothetical protein
MFADTAIFQRNRAIEDRAVDRAAVLVNTEGHVYFGVNRVGARIWSLLEQPHRLTDLVRILTGEFAVDEAVCRRETEAFLRQLMVENLVVRRTESGR